MFNTSIKIEQPPAKLSQGDLFRACTYRAGFFDMVPQSGMESGATMSMSSTAQAQNVKFFDHAEDYVLDIGGESEMTRWGQDAQDADLANFFSRPIKLRSVSWGTGTTLFDSFNPWQLYFENPRVANRIANFNLMRAKLHVKIVVNGNGFHYGRAIASYLPFANFDTLSSNAALVPQTLVQASQQPHIFLDPTLSRGGEMILPFFYYKNNLNIPDADWRELGELTIRSINGLKHANGATDVANVSVFCWAEDVYLNVLTSFESTTLVPQMGSETDEANSKGFISGPATSIASAASVMTKVPVVGPYALATQNAATAVAGAAKVLGYSRPNMTSLTTVIPALTTSLANTTLLDKVDKLTVDDQQELSIDPRISGSGILDPFCIKSIATRESYLTSFSWNIGTSPETLLWNTRVTPVTWSQSSNAYHFPACAMAAYPFRYWSGSMNYRFQIVASSFHKGRIKIVYDPNFISTNEYNTNYLEIVDITEKSDFTICVKNGQAETLLDRAFVPDALSTIYSTTNYASRGIGNGVLGVFVVNSLTTPNSTVNNDIQINVYISAGDDFEVFVPIDEFQEFVFKPQMGMEVAESESTEEKDAPAHTLSSGLGGMDDSMNHIASVYVGECVKSFRPLLKRYAIHTCISPSSTANANIYYRQPMYPYLRGNVTGAVHLTNASAPYTYVNTMLFSWITCMYSGIRGSMRYKFMQDGALSTGVPYVAMANRSILRGYEVNVAPAPVSLNVRNAAQTVMYQTAGTTNNRITKYNGHQGVAWRNSLVNPNLEVEMPFYSKYRFIPGKVQNWTTTAPSTDKQVCETLEFRGTLTGATNTLITIFMSIGEDFQAYFFTGAPPLFWENAPPA